MREVFCMSNIAEIERAIEQLSPEEMQALRAWFAERDAVHWDRQFEADVAAGKLDALAQQALGELGQGRCTDL
jgi:hypothetical protein